MEICFQNSPNSFETSLPEFAEFLRAFEKQRGVHVDMEDELDTIDAFVALGTSQPLWLLRSSCFSRGVLPRMITNSSQGH